MPISTLEPIYIAATGMACPVGLSWSSACAALRVGITRKSLSHYRDNEGREIVASWLRSHIPEHASAEERCLYFLCRALTEAASSLDRALIAQMSVLVAMPHKIPTEVLARALSVALHVSIAPRNLTLFHEGACAGLVALSRAREVANTGVPCLVAGAESMLSARALLQLSEKHRLLTYGNSDGLAPGEGAAALLVTKRRSGAMATLSGIGIAHEAATLDNDIPLRADGLAEAARSALDQAGLELHDVDFRFSNAAGESFYFKEQSLLLPRLMRARKPEFPLWLVAESLGDTGAAASICGIAWAIAGWEREYAPGPRAIGLISDARGQRAAVVIERAR